ncbi:S1C family serine protease [Thalassotalea aquiviva]|uniref:S1C family serine protease n=1 Tax=Thalassotalea aquiviva TaxID=3242415 RepID=UPI003529E74E
MKPFLFCLFYLFSFFSYSQQQAQLIFQHKAPSVFQIRLIDKATAQKSAIGSGFQISAQGHIATNYHVISGYAQHPDKYLIEYEDHQGHIGELTLLSVDVINDLAVVMLTKNPQPKFFRLAKTTPEMGEQVFSLGNPHDLGMIVVPGTYNGLKKDGFNDRIHFTGSVNPGMSGGPVVNANGEIVGINVATSGNQIGFLIPHDKLASLISRLEQQVDKPIQQQITEQLKANQSRLLGQLLASEWPQKTFVQALIPASIADFIPCWGNSNADAKDALLFKAVTTCQMDEYVYLSDTFNTGMVNMEFYYFEADELSSTRFYQLYQTQFAQASANNRASKDDVTEFECQHDITQIEQQGIKNKSILCVRAYKKYHGLFDVMYIAASIDKTNKAIVSHYTLAGVAEDLAQQFNLKFMESLAWN